MRQSGKRKKRRFGYPPEPDTETLPGTETSEDRGIPGTEYMVSETAPNGPLGRGPQHAASSRTDEYPHRIRSYPTAAQKTGKPCSPPQTRPTSSRHLRITETLRPRTGIFRSVRFRSYDRPPSLFLGNFRRTNLSPASGLTVRKYGIDRSGQRVSAKSHRMQVPSPGSETKAEPICMRAAVAFHCTSRLHPRISLPVIRPSIRNVPSSYALPKSCVCRKLHE